MNTRVDYKSIVDLVRQEFIVLQRSDERFSELLFDVEDERLLAKQKDRDLNRMYIQIKFGAANTFGQASVPFSLEVIGVNQDVELTQEFLGLFVNTYNREVVGNAQQFYLTPVVSQNNIPIYEGYRSLFIISGTILIFPDLANLSGISYIYGENNQEEIQIISYNDSAETSLNPQPYPNLKGRTKSYASFQTFAFTINIYPDNTSQLVKDLFTWKFGDANEKNRTFVFNLTFKNVTSPVGWSYKCRNVDYAYKIGEPPMLTATFTL